LFVSASEQKALFDIYEDFQYLSDLYDNSEDFRLFTQNAGIGASEMRAFNNGLKDVAPFHEQTFKFLEILAENKRLVYLKGIAERYAKLYQQVNKEEKITIISAIELNDSERAEVLSALQENP
jgi:ATP synthase F1 delta subunit